MHILFPRKPRFIFDIPYRRMRSNSSIRTTLFPHPFGRLRINILSQDSGCASKLNAQLKENFVIRVHGNCILRDPSFCFTTAEGNENYDVKLLRNSFAIIWMIFCGLD
ncbi:hypothetical protein CEXT_731771 [Caerostris extrusa]|uniref:Uncharacterized protein n=1 Tax=Caerostris extrusa TaxID=172846 RepID=A0AAV4NB29_CAEEX|nr:hypothetical protein CEXT_731771 [Caerostris extrusa]